MIHDNEKIEHWQSVEIRDNFGHVAFLRLAPFGPRGVEVNVAIDAEVRPEQVVRILLVCCRAIPINNLLVSQIIDESTERAIETIDCVLPSPPAGDQ